MSVLVCLPSGSLDSSQLTQLLTPACDSLGPFESCVRVFITLPLTADSDPNVTVHVLAQVYDSASKLAMHLHQFGPTLPIDVVPVIGGNFDLKQFCSLHGGLNIVGVVCPKSMHFNDSNELKIVQVDVTSSGDAKDEGKKSSEQWIDKYKVTVLGGTFDHLHGGHKVLITIAALHASEKLYVGIAAQDLLKKKKFASELEEFSLRASRVVEFVNLIWPKIACVTEELTDIYGPSVYDDVEMLVVSRETKSGGEAVNKKRVELNRKPADLLVLELVG
jgi:pantetheine-phosphate adenylyltransferase